MVESVNVHQTETATAPPRPELQENRKVWQSQELLAGQCEALIVHAGQVYRLRCTKHGKLILYK